jgi:hypothetical protein
VDKLGRTYKLRVQKSDQSFLELELPFTVEFNVERKTLAANAQSSIRIYNLSQDNRNLIRKDAYNFSELRTVTLNAGYGNDTPAIFTGNISQAWSAREGVNFISNILADDRGFISVNGYTNRQYPKGTPKQSIILDLVNSLTPLGIVPGVIAQFDGVLLRGNAYNGNTIDILNTLTGGGFFVDNGKAYCLKDNDTYQGTLEVITSASGLLGTPIREQSIINIDMIFEPRLTIGQRVKLESIEGIGSADQIFKVVSLKHRGMISETVCGTAVTSVGLSAGTSALAEVD